MLADRELCCAELGRIRASPAVLSLGWGACGSDSSGFSSCGGILAAARAPGGAVARRRRRWRLCHGGAEAVPSMAGELGWLGLSALGGGTGRLSSALGIPDGGSSAKIANGLLVPAAKDFPLKWYWKVLYRMG